MKNSTTKDLSFNKPLIQEIMKIHSVVKYKYKGKEYESLKAIKEELHNTIGEEFLDEMQRNCPLEKHKDYLKLLELICSPKIRKVLLETLNVTFEKEDEDGDKVEINVLDVK